MKNNISLTRLLFTLIGSILSISFAYAQPQIITSISPIASIVAMLTHDHISVLALNNEPGCPHHYHIKPSDSAKVQNAQMLIYIHDHFDGYLMKLKKRSDAIIINISNIPTLNLLDIYGQQNWHFWLDLQNVLILQEELAKVIIAAWPQLADVIEHNKSIAKQRIESLMHIKRTELATLPTIIVMSDSLEHFVRSLDGKIIRLYQTEHQSLKDYQNITSTLDNNLSQCILVDTNQDTKPYKKFNKKVVQIDSENWVTIRNTQQATTTTLTPAINHNVDLFYNKYLEMIALTKTCIVPEQNK